jgi:hypothetical protein
MLLIMFGQSSLCLAILLNTLFSPWSERLVVWAALILRYLDATWTFLLYAPPSFLLQNMKLWASEGHLKVFGDHRLQLFFKAIGANFCEAMDSNFFSLSQFAGQSAYPYYLSNFCIGC